MVLLLGIFGVVLRQSYLRENKNTRDTLGHRSKKPQFKHSVEVTIDNCWSISASDLPYVSVHHLIT
jgi:hypothetical protein